MSMEVLYITRTGCGVCSAIRPRVQAMVAKYELCQLREINLDEEPEAAGRYEVFSLPAVLIFVDGQESIREARFFDMDALEHNVDRLYTLRFS